MLPADHVIFTSRYIDNLPPQLSAVGPIGLVQQYANGVVPKSHGRARPADFTWVRSKASSRYAALGSPWRVAQVAHPTRRDDGPRRSCSLQSSGKQRPLRIHRRWVSLEICTEASPASTCRGSLARHQSMFIWLYDSRTLSWSQQQRNARHWRRSSRCEVLAHAWPARPRGVRRQSKPWRRGVQRSRRGWRRRTQMRLGRRRRVSLLIAE